MLFTVWGRLQGQPHHLVGTGTVNDPAHRTTHELDVIAFGLDDDDRHPLLAIGEAKWGETLGPPHLDRLRHIRDLSHRPRPARSR